MIIFISSRRIEEEWEKSFYQPNSKGLARTTSWALVVVFVVFVVVFVVVSVVVISVTFAFKIGEFGFQTDERTRPFKEMNSRIRKRFGIFSLSIVWRQT